MLRHSRQFRTLGPIASVALGILFFFDIIGVFGLRLAIIGLASFVLLALGVVRWTPASGVDR